MTWLERLQQKIDEYRFYQHLREHYDPPIAPEQLSTLLQEAQLPGEVLGAWKLFKDKREDWSGMTAAQGCALVAEHAGALDERVIGKMLQAMTEEQNWHPAVNLVANPALTSNLARQILDHMRGWLQDHPYTHTNQNIYRALQTLGEQELVPPDHPIKTWIARRGQEEDNTPLQRAILKLHAWSVEEVEQHLAQLDRKHDPYDYSNPESAFHARGAINCLQWLCQYGPQDMRPHYWVELFQRSSTQALEVLEGLSLQKRQNLLTSRGLTKLLAHADQHIRQRAFRLLRDKEQPEPTEHKPTR